METNKHTLRLYWEQVRKYKTSFFIMLFFIPIASLMIDTLLPFFLTQAIGQLSAGNHTAVANSLTIAGAIGAVGVLLHYIGFQGMTHHESKLRTTLGNVTFAKIINKDFDFFVNTKSGSLTTRFIDFVRSETTLQDLLVIRTIGFVLSVIVGLVILTFASWPVAVFIALLITALIFQIKWSMKKREPLRHERKELIGEIHGHVADAVTNNLVVKTFAGEATEIATLKKLNDRMAVVYKNDIGFLATEGSARVALMTAIQIIAIALATYLVMHGQLAIEGALFTLVYLQRIASQLFVLGDMLNGFDQALLEAAPMSEILTRPLTVTDKPDAKPIANIQPTIAFNNVSYHYEDGKDAALSNINLAIPAGQKIGVVGHSGAGKTTITHVLLRFADITAGEITVGGHNIQDITQQSLREHIAYVPQEPMLFHRSLRTNIAYGRPDATDDEIRAAAKKANALEFIEALPQGFDTLVGERGVKLSGGQRQRVAIARAILKDAPILVLDEATSALDSESEKLIQDALEKLMQNRTSIVIAHRLSTIAKLDRIIVLENGTIIEDGTHSELISKSGIYAKLWDHQSGGFIEE